MPRLITLIGFFLLGVLFWGLWLLPAEPFVRKADGLVIADSGLTVKQVSGRLWQGQTTLQWQQHQVNVKWKLNWSGLRPGARFWLDAGELQANGWLSPGFGRLLARDVELRVPVDEISRYIPEGQADGLAMGTINHIHLGQDAPSADGHFKYSGGQASWPPDGQATIPPLDGHITTEGDAIALQVTDPSQVPVFAGRLDQEGVDFRIFRAWARILGVSEGGDDSDVVFQVQESFVR